MQLHNTDFLMGIHFPTSDVRICIILLWYILSALVVTLKGRFGALWSDSIVSLSGREHEGHCGLSDLQIVSLDGRTCVWRSKRSRHAVKFLQMLLCSVCIQAHTKGLKDLFVKIYGKVGSVISQNSVIQLSRSSEMFTCCENSNTAKQTQWRRWKQTLLYLARKSHWDIIISSSRETWS